MKRDDKKFTINQRKMRTSIGKSKNTRPKNKRKRSTWKPYRGQGK